MTITQLEAQPVTSVPAGRQDRPVTQVVAFLGTGRMGAPMAANLARAGFVVRAWDRTAGQAAALIEQGATVAASPAEAIRGAGILITMLADGPATDQALRGPEGQLEFHPLVGGADPALGWRCLTLFEKDVVPALESAGLVTARSAP